MNDKLAAQEIANAELKNRIEDLDYDLTKLKSKEEKMEMHLAEKITKLKAYETDGDGKPLMSVVTQGKVSNLFNVHLVSFVIILCFSKIVNKLI